MRRISRFTLSRVILSRFILSLLLLVVGVGVAAPRAVALPLVAIQPLGKVDARLVRAAARQIAATFAVHVAVLDDRPLPRAAFYAPRQRYRADRVLEHLDTAAAGDVVKVVGITSCDLSATQRGVYDWGVLGLAQRSGAAAVVSTHRMGRADAPADIVALRLRRIVTHELGHALGLSHCPTPGCIMNDAGGTIRTVDNGSGQFCPACRRALGNMLRADAAAVRFEARTARATPVGCPRRLTSAAGFPTRG